jgi:hypothetical protein
MFVDKECLIPHNFITDRTLIRAVGAVPFGNI